MHLTTAWNDCRDSGDAGMRCAKSPGGALGQKSHVASSATVSAGLLVAKASPRWLIATKDLVW